MLATSGATPATLVDGAPLYDLLLAPTRIYVKSVLALLAEVPVHAIAHITGGGPTGNIPRVLPTGLEAVIDERRWPRPAVFDWLQRAGHVERELMDKPRSWQPLIYCWRGGKRSNALALILGQIGFRVHLLEGGYKAFRAAMLADLPAQVREFDLAGVQPVEAHDAFLHVVQALHQLGQRRLA